MSEPTCTYCGVPRGPESGHDVYVCLDTLRQRLRASETARHALDDRTRALEDSALCATCGTATPGLALRDGFCPDCLLMQVVDCRQAAGMAAELMEGYKRERDAAIAKGITDSLMMLEYLKRTGIEILGLAEEIESLKNKVKEMQDGR